MKIGSYYASFKRVMVTVSKTEARRSLRAIALIQVVGETGSLLFST